MCPRKFMVVNLFQGIEKVSVCRQGWSILKDTNSDASLNARVSFDSYLNRFASFASFTIAQSSLKY